MPEADTDAVRRSLARHAQEADAVRETVSELLNALPERLRHWQIGETDAAHGIPIEVWEGENAAELAWSDLSARRLRSAAMPQQVSAVIPGFNRLRPPSTPDNPFDVPEFGRIDHARLLIPEDGASFALSLSEVAFSTGTALRTRHQLPSWFWVDSDATVAVPERWGEPFPRRVVLLHNPPLAGLATTLFELLWASATPLEPRCSSEDWDPLLTHMNAGETLESASRLIGVHPRTGQRRVSAAMKAYGVTTLFALGHAWSADRRRTTGSIG